jgi:RNA-directed DNA polymerase
MAAGVIEDGSWTAFEEGVPQGASVSPLLANVYAHYAFDLWAHQWRTRHARGDVVICASPMTPWWDSGIGTRSSSSNT